MINNADQPILIVEDSQVDYEAIRWSLEKVGSQNPIYYCEDGDDALDFLNRRGEYSDPVQSPRPGLILLDLNMPGTDGRETLAAIKQDESLKSIPVIIFTTSTNPEDIEVCYREGANSYMQKPVGLDRFQDVMRRLKDFWLEIVTTMDLE